MDELQRPDVFDVEEIFNQFVTDFGGKVVSESILQNHNKPNADYYFEDYKIVAELKCLQKDTLREEDDFSRTQDLLNKWVEKKWINQKDIFKIILGKKKLPQKCVLDILSIAEKSIDRVIYKAAKQIAQTKLDLEPTAKGLLLICADGNYLLNHHGFLNVIAGLLQRKYQDSEIDGFVYFTVNQNSYNEEINSLDWQVWVPGYRMENDEVLSDFVNKLGNDFLNDFFTKLTGNPSKESIVEPDIDKGLDNLKELKFIPKNVIYNKKGSR